MIQRIQSVYLALAAILLGLMLVFDGLWEGGTAQMLPWYVPALNIVGAAALVVAVGAIFLYRNREKQIRLVLAAQIIVLIFMIILYGGLFISGEYELLSERAQLDALVALVLPIVAYLMLVLARKAIRRDIDVVKSMDRLR